jgi:hypothetical protein
MMMRHALREKADQLRMTVLPLKKFEIQNYDYDPFLLKAASTINLKYKTCYVDSTRLAANYILSRAYQRL